MDQQLDARADEREDARADEVSPVCTRAHLARSVEQGDVSGHGTHFCAIRRLRHGAAGALNRLLVRRV